jgi:hypothetical protein
VGTDFGVGITCGDVSNFVTSFNAAVDSSEDTFKKMSKRGLFTRETEEQALEAISNYDNKLTQACQFHDAAIAMGVLGWYLEVEM